MTKLFENKLIQAPVNLDDISQVLEVGAGTGTMQHYFPHA